MSYFLSLFVSHLDLHSLTHLFPTRRASDHPPVILVKGRIVICSGGLVGLPQALNSCPRAPSRLTQLGQVRRSPVSFTGSCVLIAMRCSAARFTTSRWWRTIYWPANHCIPPSPSLIVPLWRT